MKRLAFTLVVLCAACGSDSANGVVASGPTSFTSADAYSVTYTWMGGTSISAWLPGESSLDGSSLDGSGPFDATSLVVHLDADAGACGRVAAKTIKASTTTVYVEVSHRSTDPIAPGTYRLGSIWAEAATPVASVDVITSDDSCTVATEPHRATSGTVTLSQVTANGVAGSVDVTLDDETTLRGQFDAPHCAAAEELFPDDFTCAP